MNCVELTFFVKLPILEKLSNCYFSAGPQVYPKGLNVSSTGPSADTKPGVMGTYALDEEREEKAGQVFNRTEQYIGHNEKKNDERSRKMGFLHLLLLYVSLHDACSLSSPITFRTGEPFATIFLVIFGHVAF